MRKLLEDMYDGEQGELFGISWESMSFKVFQKS